MANNLIRTKKSIDCNLNEQTSNSTMIDLVNSDCNQEQKSAYQIPSPTMLLPTDLSSSSKPITSGSSSMSMNKISRSTPSESHRNLVIFNQANSFYLKHPEESTSEKFSTIISTISSQLIQTTDQANLSMRRSVTQMTNEIVSSSVLPLSHDLKLLGDHETVSPFEISPQIKARSESKHESESLWKTKFTLKTLLAMANRDEAQALKDRKPIDYHLFLCDKWKTNSILHYQDDMERKFTTNNKHSIIEQVNEEENRKLYQRLLSTMNLGKRRSMVSPRKTHAKRSKDSRLTLTDAPEKVVLITYEAKPISSFNK